MVNESASATKVAETLNNILVSKLDQVNPGKSKIDSLTDQAPVQMNEQNYGQGRTGIGVIV